MSENIIKTKIYFQTKSFRTTIPKAIASIMNIKKGDTIEWQVKYDYNNREPYIIIRKINNNDGGNR